MVNWVMEDWEKKIISKPFFLAYSEQWRLTDKKIIKKKKKMRVKILTISEAIWISQELFW